MAFQQGTDTLTCPHCGARHKARWDRLPVREEYSIRCKSCRSVLTEGKSNKDYFAVELTEA